MSFCQFSRNEALNGACSQKGAAFEGDDIPYMMSIPEMAFVKLEVEESIHYEMAEAEGESDWLYSSPRGAGAFRYGPDHRSAFSAMTHQMHCVQGFGRQLVSSIANDDDWTHLTHCLNYMRQMILCQADLTLEPGDFSTRNFTEDRGGATYVCQDWNAVYETLQANWLEWYKYRYNHNMSHIREPDYLP
ncbi:hypothetical protein DENSPDRAFT_785091 [Dentipellis sp. KUC8613]|nr:hypothetical protein DENSPDRAFT_785091 [Dentipellis sp. KUC8613]